MTPSQRSTIIDIGQRLKHDPKNHPSESFRESFEMHSQQEIDDCVAALRRIYADDDGYRAFLVIKAERERCLSSVVSLHKEGQI